MGVDEFLSKWRRVISDVISSLSVERQKGSTTSHFHTQLNHFASKLTGNAITWREGKWTADVCSLNVVV